MPAISSVSALDSPPASSVSGFNSPLRFVASRVSNALVVALLVPVLTLFLLGRAPGDYLSELAANPQVSTNTLAQLRAQYGIDQPLSVKYISWIKNAVRGDLGFSLVYQRPIRELLGAPEVDVIIETSGNPSSISKTLPLLGSGGRYILLGQPKPGESVEIANAHHLFSGEGKSITATQGGRFSPSRDIPRYVRLEKAGLLRFDDLITHRTTLDGVNDAIALMRAGRANRIFIDLWA